MRSPEAMNRASKPKQSQQPGIFLGIFPAPLLHLRTKGLVQQTQGGMYIIRGTSVPNSVIDMVLENSSATTYLDRMRSFYTRSRACKRAALQSGGLRYAHFSEGESLRFPVSKKHTLNGTYNQNPQVWGTWIMDPLGLQLV